MPNDLDQMLADSLQERAEVGSPIDPAPMMQAAVVRGRRIQFRRRLVSTTLAALTVGAIVTAGVLVPRHADHVPPPAGSREVTGGNLDRLPAADYTPGAASQPNLIGTDPGTLHFTLGTLPKNAESAGAGTEAGYEWASASAGDFSILVTLAQAKSDLERLPAGYTQVTGLPAPTATTFAGHPALISTLTSKDPVNGRPPTTVVLSWPTGAGPWIKIRVAAATPEKALQLAQQVRFDQAQRCIVPFKFDYLPPKAALLGCSVNLGLGENGGVIARSAIIEVGDSQRRVDLEVQDSGQQSGNTARPLKAGPYHVAADPGGKSWSMAVPPYAVTATNRAKTPYTQRQILSLLGSMTFTPRPQDPLYW